MQANPLCGRCPELEGHTSAIERCTQLTVVGEQHVEDAGGLHFGGIDNPVVRVIGDHHQLAHHGATQGMCAGLDPVRRGIGQMRVLALEAVAQAGRLHRQGLSAADGTRLAVDANAGIVGIAQLDAAGARCAAHQRKRERIEPVRTGALDRHGAAAYWRAGQLRVAADREDATAQFVEAPDQVGTAQILLIALVHDQVQAAGVGAEWDAVERAMLRVGLRRRERLRPAGFGRTAVAVGGVPQVRAPAVVIAVGALVVEQGLVRARVERNSRSGWHGQRQAAEEQRRQAPVSDRANEHG